jgi:hypothetical protein
MARPLLKDFSHKEKRSPMRYQLPLALLLASSATACVNDAASGTDEDTVADVTTALEQENGGLDISDEAPMFGQPLAFDAAAIERDAQFTDAMESNADVTTIANVAGVVRHRLVIVWGRMPADPDATTARNWSGSLTLSRGAMLIGRTIGFEDQTDSVLPRQNIARVDFESVTKPHADGLVLRLLDPDPSQGALHLTYTSADAATTHDLDLSQLANGPIVVDAGDGNRVIALAVREGDPCDHGFMRGRWVALQPGMGVYRGVVTDENGAVTGHLRGIWGQRQNGDKVMFGKFIATDGSFRGILAGQYDAGHYRARWLTGAGDRGIAGGVYFDAPNVRGGIFAGRWLETTCAQQ